MASENTHTATDTNFDSIVLASDLPVLVDFWASWCGPCRAIAPHLDKIADDLVGKVKIVKLNAESDMATAQRYNVANLPTFLLFKGGVEVDRKIGTGGGAAGLRKFAESAL